MSEDLRRRKNAQQLVENDQQLVDKVCIQFFHVSLKVRSKQERINFSSSLTIVSEHLVGKGGESQHEVRPPSPNRNVMTNKLSMYLNNTNPIWPCSYNSQEVQSTDLDF